MPRRLFSLLKHIETFPNAVCLYSRRKPNPAAISLPCPLEIALTLLDGICFMLFFFLLHLPYNLRDGNPAFYLLQGPFSNSACFVL